MSFNWNDYSSLAEGLIKDPGDLKEAALRTAVSRAYYAAYNLAVEYAVENHSYVRQKVNAHLNLQNHFRKENIRVTRHLRDLSQWRKQCDYDSTVENLESQMIPSVVNRVSNLISLLN